MKKNVKKLILLFLSTLLFFSCASQDTEAETSPEILEPIPFEETVENQLVEGENPTSTENQVENIENPEIEDENNLENQIETEIELQNETENNPLVINPENYTEPDYVEFLPVFIPEEKQEELLFEQNLDESLSNDVILDYDSEIDKSQENLETIQNQLLDEVKSEENILDKLETIEETQEENQQEEIIENQSEMETSESTILKDQPVEQADEPTKEEIPEQPVEQTTELTEKIENPEENFSYTEPEDIPMEEIFIPDENFIPLEPEETATIEATREMDINSNEILKVSFPGTGWIFLGDEYDSDILTFDRRDIYDDFTDFFLKSKKSGTALLHFFKQDLLTNEPINDYLLVNVNAKKGKLEIVEAPEYVFSSFEDDLITEEENSIEDDYFYDEYYDDYGFIEDEPEVIIFDDAGFFVDDEISKKDIIDLAESFYQDDFYYETLDQLNYYFEVLGDSEDEYTDYALFMLGQLLEKQTPIRNIKESLAAYKKIVQSFPDSQYWNQAKQRVTYLERFYFSVR